MVYSRLQPQPLCSFVNQLVTARLFLCWLEKLVPTLHVASVYALLSEFSSANQASNAHLTKLTNLLFFLLSIITKCFSTLSCHILFSPLSLALFLDNLFHLKLFSHSLSPSYSARKKSIFHPLITLTAKYTLHMSLQKMHSFPIIRLVRLFFLCLILSTGIVRYI